MRFREELDLEGWRGDRLESRRSFVQASDGERRVSTATADPGMNVVASATIDFPARRSLKALPLDPLWLTDAAPMLTGAQDHENLATALADLHWAGGAAATTARETAIVNGSTGRRLWTARFDAGQRTPARLEGFPATVVVATLRPGVGARPATVAKAERTIPALSGPAGALEHRIAEIAEFDVPVRVDAKEFALAPPPGAKVIDRTKPLAPTAAKTKGGKP